MSTGIQIWKNIKHQMKFNLYILCFLFGLSSCIQEKTQLKSIYYFDPIKGNDHHTGLTASSPLKSLSKLSAIDLLPGDRVLLAAGQLFSEPLILKNQHGTISKPIVISTFGQDDKKKRSLIHVSGYAHALLVENSSFIELENLDLSATARGSHPTSEKQNMRCGILIKSSEPGYYEHLYLKNINVHDVYYESAGYHRPKGEVRTANGTQNYGWGIRLMSTIEEAYLVDVKIDSAWVSNVAHTGIKVTGRSNKTGQSIQQLQISNSKVSYTGGPGIQMSDIKNGHIFGNEVTYSGSSDDSRKWGRGSGLWTWSASHVLIENNRFTHANGPGDSAGAHIDFNCNDIVLQYNFSAYNAGGFCEILGNNYNCAYRYNISVNDGHRVKGENGAFQEGKIFWLSGYNGGQRNGPFNSYFYNNTIIVDQGIETKIAIDNVANGVLIANNIFYVKEHAKMVRGDQNNPQNDGKIYTKDVFFSNNLFLHESSWPKDATFQDVNPIYGNPDFSSIRTTSLASYTPRNTPLIQNRGVPIPKLTHDSIGLVFGLAMTRDILGRPIQGKPDIGAIEIQD